MMEHMESLSSLNEKDSVEDFIDLIGCVNHIRRVVMSHLVAELILEYGVEIGSQ